MLSSPSPRAAVGREGRSEAKARVGGFSSTPPPRCSFHSHRPSPPLACARGGRDKKMHLNLTRLHTRESEPPHPPDFAAFPASRNDDVEGSCPGRGAACNAAPL